MAGGPAVVQPWRETPRGYGTTNGLTVPRGTRVVTPRQQWAKPSPVAPQWTPPPIPAGLYNPIRDIELSEGQRGSQQSITGLEREKTNAENTYGTNLGLLGQREAREAQQQKDTLARLAESYAKLGGRQGEAANRLGVVNGGALIASAAKRAANEGVTKAADERGFAQQRQADENERGRLATEQGQLTGPGGSLVEAIQNAQTNQQAFAGSVGTVKENEAAAHGYEPPAAPKPRLKRVNGLTVPIGTRVVHPGSRRV